MSNKKKIDPLFLEMCKKHNVKYEDFDIDDNKIVTPGMNQQKVTHRQVLNEMLKLIDVVPMDDSLKMILRMRVWGEDPAVFKPLTIPEISKLLKVSETVVDETEEEAKNKLKEYLEKYHIGDVIHTFNRSKRGECILYDVNGKPITG